MKRMGWFVLFSIFVLMIAGSHLSAAEVGVTDTTIKLGHFGDMSGPAAYIGEMVVGSTQAYLGMVNQEGGVLGRKLELVIEDNKYDPTLTKSAFTKLVSQHRVFMLINVYGSSPCTAIFPDIEKEKIPVIPTYAGASSMFDPPKKYLFWLANNGVDEGLLVVDFIVKDLKAQKPKIGICYQDDEWGKDGLQGIIQGCKKHKLDAPVTAPYKRGEFKLGPQAMKLKAAGVTHCFYVGYAPVYVALLKAAHDVGWKPVFFGDYVSVDTKTFQMGKELSHGHYHVLNTGLPQENVPGAKKMSEAIVKYGAKVDVNNPLIPMLWAGCLAWTEGLKRAGKDLTREKFITAMETLKEFPVDGLMAPLTYGPNLRKGAHYYRILRADYQKQLFVPASDWRRSSAD